jgi:lipopolysaccharide transport system ATP-binding protein
LEPIIEIRGVSKEYHISVTRGHYQGGKRLTESLENTLSHPIKTIKGIRESKETFWALKDISFNVEEGQVVGIIGRNGAGKSTLLKILSQITYPTEGEVILRGRVGSLLEVGTGFHPDLTGRDNIYLNGAILGMKKKEINSKFDDIVKFAEVEKFLDTPIKRYSSGMLMRLAFSVAAHLEPDILIADEVLAVGDQQFQNKSLGKMKEVSQEGRTVIFVSHNIHAIRSLCETGVLLKSGRMEKIGTVDEVIEEYARSMEVHDEIFPIRTPEIIINGLKICQKDTETNLIDGTFPFEITIDFEIPNPIDQLRMGVSLKNSLGDEVLRSYFSDWNVKLERFNVGKYKAHLTFPDKLLNAGNYSINVEAKKMGNVSLLSGFVVERLVNISSPVDFVGGASSDSVQSPIILNRIWDIQKVV